MNRPIVKEIK